MKKAACTILCVVMLTMAYFAAARAEVFGAAPILAEPPFTPDCACAILVEPSGGQILFEYAADEERPVASVTKVMSILLALEAVEDGRAALTDEITVSAQASGMGGSQVLLDTGETQTLSLLLKSMIVASANDATVAVAEYLYGSEALFVTRMNRRAQELGMDHTCFVNATGLPAEGQHTTARDIARMAAELFRHELYFEFSTVWLDELDHRDGRVTSLTNTNRLIRTYDGCDGGKTGSTNEAGYCVAATAARDGMRLICVVLGAATGKTRFSAAEKMFDFGFANYRLVSVVHSGARMKEMLPVTSGTTDYVPLMLDGDLTLLLDKSESADVTLTPNLPAAIEAPVTVGQPVGTVDVVHDGRTVARIRVVAAESVEGSSFKDGWRRAWEKWLF